MGEARRVRRGAVGLGKIGSIYFFIVLTIFNFSLFAIVDST